MTALTLPYPPSGNRYWRHAKGRTYLSAEARVYRAAVALVAPVLPLDGPVSVTLTVYRPRKMGDLDNTFKVLLDALNGLAWHDDSQIEELHGYRHDDKDNPRVEVEVKRLSSRTTERDVIEALRRAVLPARCSKGGCRKRLPCAEHSHQLMQSPDVPPCYAKGQPCRRRRHKHPSPGFTPPRSKGLDAPALAAETFAPPPNAEGCDNCAGVDPESCAFRGRH